MKNTLTSLAIAAVMVALTFLVETTQETLVIAMFLSFIGLLFIGIPVAWLLAAAGEAGLNGAMGLMRAEMERDIKLMGLTRVDQLSRSNLRFKEMPLAPQIRLAAE
ncbi:MAG: alpha-hydroxy-acid oxidizing protein [Pseudomonadota bacterium]